MKILDFVGTKAGRTTTIVVSALLLSVLALQIYTQRLRLMESYKWVAHTMEVREAASNLERIAMDGSRAIRGYILTGNEESLNPFQRMLSELMPQFNKLAHLTRDNSVQQQRLTMIRPLLQQRIDESSLQYRLYQEKGAEAARLRVATGSGIKLSKQITTQINVFQAEEYRLLKLRERRVNETSSKSLMINLAVVLLMLGLIAMAYRSFLRELHQQVQHSHQLSMLNARLDANNSNLELANTELIRSDRFKNEFLSAMSHELRTPLNSIIGFTGILKMGIPGPLNEEQNKQLGLVETSAMHLLHLINDLLDLSRIEAGQATLELEDIDLRDSIKEVFDTMKPLAEAKALTLRAECGSEPVLLHTDVRKLYQVLLNLVNNAVKFSTQGTITVSCLVRDGACEIIVSDQGIGMTPNQLSMLFQAFIQIDVSSRKNFEGTGLGLYLSKKLVNMMGGSIRAESELGKGSRFILTLPITQ